MCYRYAVLALFMAGPLWADDAKLLKTAQSLYEGVRQETLPNGLRVYLKPIPGSPVVTTKLGYKVGAADEELDQTGLSHYLEHLMFKGTDMLMPGDIDRLTQRNGGQNNAYTSEDMTVYHFDFAADRWLAALEIEADRMRNLRIDTKHEFEQEKGAVISELDGNEDEPWELEIKQILPLLFGAKTPYGHPVIGQKEHVRAATADIIKKHYDRWYHPNNAVLVVVGGFDEKEALAQITKLFGSIPSTKLPERKPIPEPTPRAKTVRQKFASKFETPRLLMGYNTVAETHADSVALDVVSYLLSAGKTSRLHKRLIEDDGTCLQIAASHSSGRYPGWFAFQAELLKNDLAKVEEAIHEELKLLATQGPTEVELKRVRRTLLAAHIFEDESIHKLADTITQGVIANDLAFVQAYLPSLMKVSAADVKRVVQKYLLDQAPVVIESLPMGEPKGVGRPVVRPSIARQKHREVPVKDAGALTLKNAKTVVLDNGLKLLLLENHRLPIVVANAHVGKVRLHEPADQVGVASLLGDLLEEGTAKRTGPEIALAIENTGGSLSMSGSGGTIQVLSDDMPLGLELLVDCLMNPAIGKEELESKREQLLAEIAEDEKTADKRASRAFMAAVYGKHPYGRLPAVAEVVKKLTPNDLKAFHQRVFVPNNTILTVVGDFDSAKLIEQVKELTAKWKKQPMAQPDLPTPPAPEAKTTILTDANAAQLQVFIGHLGIKRTNPDYFKLLVMDYVLGTGSGFTDRLSASLRDRQGLAYTVNATITETADEEPGVFTGYIGTFPDKFTQVKDGFLQEINRIRDEVPSKQEVEDAKKYLTGSLAFRLTTCAGAAKMLLLLDRYQLGANYFEDYKQAVNRVTPEEIQAVAKQYLNPDKLTVIVVGAVDSTGKALPKKE